MIRFFANADYDFIGFRRYAYGVTAAVLIPGLLLTAVRGLNYSIEFTGGTLVQVRARQSTPAGQLRRALDQGGLRGAEITAFGSSGTEYAVRARLTEGSAATEQEAQAVAEAVTGALNQAFGEGAFTLMHRETVGPRVGGELRQRAILAILASFAVVLVYLAYRFEWRFGLAAIIATGHDILTTVAFITAMKLEVSLVVVSGILTMVGYSLNDTIIIFDRTRENLHKYKREDLGEILNRSINETLPRSILTHGTTMGALIALLIFGGEVIRPFSWVMLFGVFTGTFSSIYIAAPILLWIEHKWPGKEARGVKARVVPAHHLHDAPATPKA